MSGRPKKTRDPEIARARQKTRRQKASAEKRAKYGPSGKPAPITCYDLQSGEILEVVSAKRWVRETPKKSSRGRRPYSPALDRAAVVAGYVSYEAYISSAYWRAIRKSVLVRDGNRCRRCGGRKQLTVHHETYKYVGNEQLDQLVTLCLVCHRTLHGVH